MKKASQLIKADIAERLHQFDELGAEILACLDMPPTSQHHIWPVLRNHRLTLVTDDAHIATHARFQQNALRKQLGKRLNLKISAVNIKLIVLPLASFEQKTSTFKLSRHAAPVVQHIASSIRDTNLRDVLLSLANTASRAE